MRLLPEILAIIFLSNEVFASFSVYVNVFSYFFEYNIAHFLFTGGINKKGSLHSHQ